MIECREIVDSVKADISSASPSLNMDTSVTSEKQTEVKIVLDKDGNICRECTDLQVSNPEEKIVNNKNEVHDFRPSRVCQEPRGSASQAGWPDHR